MTGNIAFIFGGCSFYNTSDDQPTYFNDFYMLTITPTDLTWERLPQDGHIPCPRQGHSLWSGHAFAAIGEIIYMFGGRSNENEYYTDVLALDTVSLMWQRCEVKGEKPIGRSHHTFTAHSDKDIYLFGGTFEFKDGKTIPKNDIMKLSLAWMKWKKPLYIGIPPTCRGNHVAFILHNQLYIFGGINGKEFNDLMGMKLINPSDRQPFMKEIFSELGIQGINRFTPTKIPRVKYELTEYSLLPASVSAPPSAPIEQLQDFHSMCSQAMNMITKAFGLLNSEFQKLNMVKAELAQATKAFQHEKDHYEENLKNQQKELQVMLEKHKIQNEAWLKARAEENDKERKELFKMREAILQDQERLRDEQQTVQQCNQQLFSVMQQFKGM
ncbi:rab9 effector protein with kelch motifs-like isoform X3 [Candoia aspera]|uniref:rab9 effector protein with kelch motifs-like isoform X3 n=1 Tax=Candoia aspera TaxID=51853 RepID=UPI002FD85A03